MSSSKVSAPPQEEDVISPARVLLVQIDFPRRARSMGLSSAMAFKWCHDRRSKRRCNACQPKHLLRSFAIFIYPQLVTDSPW